MFFAPVLAPQAMHIPDGFLSVLVSVIFWVTSMSIIGIALVKSRRVLGERQIPLMGVLAAAIFAGQMLNFSVAGGTSGHLLGAALATILLGPWPAVLIMTAVVSIQALIFQDGGILALGANLFNMAIVGVFVAYAVYALLSKLFKKQPLGLFVSGFVSAWSSIFIASLACGLQLALSGTSPANIVIPAMAGIHALIGIGEGLITIGALGVIYATRKDLLSTQELKGFSSRSVIAFGLLISLVLVVFAPLASSHPDGLEWVAEEQGFMDAARDAIYDIIPDYTMPRINNEALATISAGIVGVLIVFLVTILISRSDKQRAKN